MSSFTLTPETRSVVSTDSKHLAYRPEIDGLRAVAVIPVIFYHAGMLGMSGGFVGVDVFFVISGFLITRNLIQDLERDQFSISKFYERRARRIIPALLLVVVFCLPLGWLLMLPDDFENLAQSVVATIFFSNNVLLNHTSGYWDLAAEFKPLVHTWSLGVEEQYYFAIPAVLYLSWKRLRRRTIWVVAGLALASFGACLYYQTRDPDLAFYMIHTRAWELLIGSFAAFVGIGAAPRNNDVLAGAGLLMILFAVFHYDESTPFPSFYAALPAIGTAFVLLFASVGSRVAKILSNPLFVGVGLISYSLYLWHQPLFAFARINSYEEPTALIYTVLIAASFLLAYFSWQLVERPFRDRRVVSLYVMAAILAPVSVAAVGFSLIVYFNQGFPSRFFSMQTHQAADFYISYNKRANRFRREVVREI